MAPSYDVGGQYRLRGDDSWWTVRALVNLNTDGSAGSVVIAEHDEAGHFLTGMVPGDSLEIPQSSMQFRQTLYDALQVATDMVGQQ